MTEGKLTALFRNWYVDSIQEGKYDSKKYLDILDEAKKEFPLRLAPDTIPMLEKEIRIHKDEQQLCAYTEDLIITLEWALKWFGAQQP